jgi:Tol biopolymer transport system component
MHWAVRARTKRRQRIGGPTWGAALLVSALVWLSAPSAQAQTVTITQITDTGANFSPSLSGSGTRVVFRSFTNLANPAGCPVLPGNPDFNGEIYLFDTGTGCFTQVTNTTTGNLFDARISANGNRIAFVYNGDLANPGGCAALPGNADGNFEVYLFDTGTGCFTQVTKTTGGGSSSPTLNAAGTRVAFESQGNLVNPGGCPLLPGNADGNIEVYLFDVGTGCFTQVTRTTGGGQGGTSLNAAGTLLAFVSNRNLANPVGCPALPGNANVNLEIYLFDVGTGCLTQVTNTSGGQNDFASLSGSGNQLAFASTVNLVNRVGCAGLPGLPGNADGNFEIYVYDVNTGCFTQVTNTTGGSNIFPTVSANGLRVAFRSTANPATPTGTRRSTSTTWARAASPRSPTRRPAWTSMSSRSTRPGLASRSMPIRTTPTRRSSWRS